MLMAGRKMKTEKILCEVCDNHCELEVEVEDEEVQDVSGNGCLIGFMLDVQFFCRQYLLIGIVLSY